MKNKKMLIISCTIIIIAIALGVTIILFNDNQHKKIDDLVSFRYYSGSSGYSTEFVGVRNENFINIDFIEYDGSNQNVGTFTIAISDFEKLLNTTKKENCKKHSYDYQCGESSGCSSSHFSIVFKDYEESFCYQINDNVSSFFDNIEFQIYKKLCSDLEIDYSVLDSKNINLFKLFEDVNSIKNNTEIINAVYKSYESDVFTYIGEGYLIKMFYNNDKTKYSIYISDGKIDDNEIWSIEK